MQRSPRAGLLVLLIAVAGCVIDDTSEPRQGGCCSGSMAQLPPDQPGDKIDGATDLRDPQWTADGKRLFALGKFPGDAKQYLLWIDIPARAAHPVIQLDSATQFVYSPDSTAIYALLPERYVPTDSSTWLASRVMRVDLASGARVSVARVQTDGSIFSRNGARLVYHAFRFKAEADTTVVLDLATGTRPRIWLDSTPGATSFGGNRVFVRAVSPDGERVLTGRLYEYQNYSQPYYPPVLFDGRVSTGKRDTTPSTMYDRNVVAAAWSGDAFRQLFRSFGLLGQQPLRALLDVKFNSSDTVRYATLPNFPEYAAWVPELQESWVAVSLGCYGDFYCTTYHFAIYYETKTTAAPIGTANGVRGTFTASPDGHWLVHSHAAPGSPTYLMHR
jgi:hypothetical protein